MSKIKAHLRRFPAKARVVVGLFAVWLLQTALDRLTKLLIPEGSEVQWFGRAVQRLRDMLNIIPTDWVMVALVTAVALYVWEERRRITAFGIFKRRSSLRLKMNGGNIFVPSGAEHLTGLALSVHTWSVGSPLCAIDWDLALVTEQGKTVRGHLSVIPEVMTLNGQAQSIIKKEQSLVEKALATPVGASPITGIILGHLE